jgi:hypothetical protein
MQPRGTARLCASCDRLVHDLSALSEGEARALLQKPPAEGLCVRYLHDAYGNIWFAGDRPDPVIPIARLIRSRASRAVAASALVLSPLLIEACGGAGPYDGYDGSPRAVSSATPNVGPAVDAEPAIDGGPQADAAADVLVQDDSAETDGESDADAAH